MKRALGVWRPVAKGMSLFECDYSFGPAFATGFAVPWDGGFAIVSPPCNVKDETFAAIEKLGKVRAIVAPNAFHTLGIVGWNKHFPDAALFAPAQSIKRVERKSGLKGIRPLSEAKPSGEGVELIDMPHYRTGEVLVRLKEGSEIAWCTTDVVLNLPIVPPKFPMKQIFGWTKSAPGLRPNNFGSAFMVKNKRALHRWLREEIEKAPPTVLATAHGDNIVEHAADRLRAIFPG